MRTIFFICSLTFLWQAHAGCPQLMRGLLRQKSLYQNSPQFSYFQKVTKIEKTTNFFRRIKENPEPTLNIRTWKKIALIDSFLFNGSHAPNERQWRTFFREFEANYISYKRSKLIVDFLLENDSINSDKFFKKLKDWKFSEEYISFIKGRFEELGSIEGLRIALELEKKTTLTHIGNNYHEYRMIRGHLEGLLETEECNEACQKLTKMLLGNLGAESQKEKMMFEIFFKGEGRPDLNEMRELLYQEELFVITRLKRERNAEIFSFFKSLVSQPEFIDTILGFVYKSNLLEKRRAVKLFKMIYNAQARNIHFPKINRVVYGPKEADKALDLLQNLNASVTGDELLTTFARRVDPLAEKKWASILEAAKKTDSDFQKRMESAAEKATARGDLSPPNPRSFVGRIAALIVIGVPTVGYFYFDGLPTSVQDFVYGEEEKVNIDAPLPEKGEEIELDGEEDLTLEEVGEVISEKVGEREPSSSSSRTKDKALFTKFWCQLFSCKAKE